MSDGTDEFSSETFHMVRRGDGIVHLTWNPGTRIDLEDARGATAAMHAMVDGAPSPLLVDTRNSRTVSRDARLEFVRRSDLVSAVALLVSTPLSRIMGNFYLAVSGPNVATRLFESEASALAWLSANRS